MAERKASLIIEIKDAATAGLESLGETLSGLKGKIAAVTAALAAVGAFIYKSVMAFGEQETAALRLNVALGNTGTSAEGASKRLQDLASALSKTTGFTDTAIVQMQAMLATMGFNEAAIAQMTPRVIDLSRALGVDLQTAAMSLGKSIETGSTMPLKRMGLIVQDTTFKNYDFAGSMAVVDGRVKGMGEAFGKTTEGGMAKFHAALDRLWEDIGEKLAPAFNVAVAAATGLVNILISTIPVIEAILSQIKELIFAMGNFGLVTYDILTGQWVAAFKTGKVAMAEMATFTVDKTRATVDAIRKMASEVADIFSGNYGKPKPGDAGPGGKPGKPGFEVLGLPSPEEMQFKILQLKGFGAQVEMLQTQQLAERLRRAGRGAEAEKLLEASKNKAILSGSVQFFSNLSALQSSKNKEMAAIGKAAASASALIQTYNAATQAYAAMAGIPIVGPALGAAASAAAIVAGLANVAQINSVQFAHGGMVMPTSGGTLATIGEAGKSEAVIPLDDPETKRKLKDTFGGGITIQVGTLVADQGGVEEFARRLDKELWRIRKNGQSVVF